MTRRSYRLSILSVLVAVVLATASPSAAHPVPFADQGPDAAAATPPTVAATCTLTPGPVNTFHYIWTPPEELRTVAWRLPIQTCTACAAAGALELRNVTFRMRWFTVCSAQVEVSVVGAMQGETCLVPDTTRVLCDPVTQTLSGPGNVAVVHTVPLPSGCCVTGEAFLLLRFTGLGACATATVGPGLAASTAPCVACEQFVTAFNIFTDTTEWCSVGAANSMWFSIDADCCQMTPSLDHSWGSIKTLYR